MGGIAVSIRCLTGRSRALRPRLYEELRAALNDGANTPLIVLVPEQYTLESEREIMAALGLNGSFRLQVMSPARLISRLFEAAGRPVETRVDERGRVMLMHAALKTLSRELSWYRGAQHRPGFSALAARQVKELKQAGYTPDRLLLLANDLRPGPLKSELADLSAVWTAYESALKGRFMDSEDELMLALSRVERADFLRGARVWAYGFELISPTLGSALVELGRTRDAALFLPLVNDEAARDVEAFEPVAKSLRRFVKLATEAGVDVTREFLNEPPERERPVELAHLLNEINSFPPLPLPGAPKRVRMASRKNPMDEAMLVMALMALSMVSWEADSDAAAVCKSSSASSRELCLVSLASAK